MAAITEKTYITPKLREPEFVMSPLGARNERGVKMKRKALKFRPNARGAGQYTTSDPKEQEYLDNLPHIKDGRMAVLDGGVVANTSETKRERTQRNGPTTSQDALRG